MADDETDKTDGREHLKKAREEMKGFVLGASVLAGGQIGTRGVTFPRRDAGHAAGGLRVGRGMRLWQLVLAVLLCGVIYGLAPSFAEAAIIDFYPDDGTMIKNVSQIKDFKLNTDLSNNYWGYTFTAPTGSTIYGRLKTYYYYKSDDSTVQLKNKYYFPVEMWNAISRVYKEGYRFDGWYTAADGGELVTYENLQSVATPAGTGTDITLKLYAHWTNVTNDSSYHTFIYNYGCSDYIPYAYLEKKDNPIVTQYQAVSWTDNIWKETAQHPSLPNVNNNNTGSTEGEFVGWYLVESGVDPSNNGVNSLSDYGSSYSVDLFPHFKAMSERYVRFHARGGEMSSVPLYTTENYDNIQNSVVYRSSYPLDTEIVLPTDISRKGYIFRGWWTKYTNDDIVNSTANDWGVNRTPNGYPTDWLDSYDGYGSLVTQSLSSLGTQSVRSYFASAYGPSSITNM